MYAVTRSVTVTTDASGDGTGYTDAVTGRIIKAIYTKVDYADGVDFTITSKTTGQNIWVQSDVNAAVSIMPRGATHDYTGTASLYAAAGEPVEDYIWLVNEEIKVVIAQGGNTKSGTFTFIVG